MTAPPELDLPVDCALIEVHVSELKQLFHSLDPTPFRERDIDPRAEFIAGWRESWPPTRRWRIVHVDHDLPSVEEVRVLCDAVREYFGERALQTRRRLRQLFRVGRTA